MSLEVVGAIAVVVTTGVYTVWKYAPNFSKLGWCLLLVSVLLWSWLGMAFLGGSAVSRTTYHHVVPIMQSDGTVVDAIIVDGHAENVSMALGCHIPQGSKVKRIEMRDYFLGLFISRQPRYEIQQ